MEATVRLTTWKYLIQTIHYFPHKLNAVVVKVLGVFGARAMSCMFDSLLISLIQLQASWHIMLHTGILAAETACLYKVRKYSLSMSRNDLNKMQTDFNKGYEVSCYPSPQL